VQSFLQSASHYLNFAATLSGLNNRAVQPPLQRNPPPARNSVGAAGWKPKSPVIIASQGHITHYIHYSGPCEVLCNLLPIHSIVRPLPPESTKTPTDQIDACPLDFRLKSVGSCCCPKKAGVARFMSLRHRVVRNCEELKAWMRGWHIYEHPLCFFPSPICFRIGLRHRGRSELIAKAAGGQFTSATLAKSIFMCSLLLCRDCTEAGWSTINTGEDITLPTLDPIPPSEEPVHKPTSFVVPILGSAKSYTSFLFTLLVHSLGRILEGVYLSLFLFMPVCYSANASCVLKLANICEPGHLIAPTDTNISNDPQTPPPPRLPSPPPRGTVEAISPDEVIQMTTINTVFAPSPLVLETTALLSPSETLNGIPLPSPPTALL